MENYRLSAEKLRRVLRSVRNGFLHTALFFLIVQVDYLPAYMEEADRYSELFQDLRLVAWVCVAVSVLLYQSLTRHTTLYDRELRTEFLSDPTQEKKEQLRFLLGKWQVWVETGIFAFWFLVLPLDAVFGSYALLFGASFPVKLPILVVLLLASGYGRLSALRAWSLPSEQGRWEALSDPRANRKKSRRQLLILVLVYSLAIVLEMGVSVLVSLLPILADPIFWKLVGPPLVCILLYAFTRRARNLHKRRKMLKRLQKVCAETEGCVLSEIRHPYRSLTAAFRGEDFTVTVSGKTYSCKLLGELAGHNPLTVDSDGTAYFHHALFRFGKLEYFPYEKSYCFGWESDKQKVLLVNPVPKQVYGSYRQKVWPADNGDSVGEYRVFTANSFINAIARDCIDRQG